MVRYWFNKPRIVIVTWLAVALLLAVACGTAAQPETSEQPASAETQVQQPAAPAEAQAQQPSVPVAEATATPVPQVAQGNLDKLVIAVAPLGWDTNYSYKVTISGLLDKRPVLEWLIGVDQNTGKYRPELAESWEMAPNGQDWTIKLRQGVQFHYDWGEFTAQDVRHSFYLLVQPESQASGISAWRKLTGVEDGDTAEIIAQKIDEMVEIVDDHTVIIRTQDVQPELDFFMSHQRNLPMESKARWDEVGGHTGYGNKIVGTGPFRFIERVEGVHVLYEAVEDHWRQTPEYKELEFRWVQEPATRLATLLTSEVHLSDVERAARPQAIAQGMKAIPSKFPAIQHRWYFGGQYYTEPAKINPDNPFLNVKVRQAMNKAINREAIAAALLGGSEVKLPFFYGFGPELDGARWPGVVNQEWFDRYDEMYGYDPQRARELLAEAGYPNGFEFDQYIYTLPGLPEMVDIGQAMALNFQEIGLKPNLVSLEYSKVREFYRDQSSEIIGAIWPSRGFSPTNYAMLGLTTPATTTHAFEHPELDAKQQELDQTVDREERARIMREMGDILYNEFGIIQMFGISTEIMANPSVIAEYVFPGNITGYYTHLEYIKTAQ
jgi:peptide/nickel transport system substrate-binding protein